VKLADAIAKLHSDELELAAAFRELSDRHVADPDVHHQARTFAGQCSRHAERLEPIVQRYDSSDGDAYARSHKVSGELLPDLREVYLAAQETLVTWVIVGQGAKAARDRELLALCQELQTETDLQMKWALTHIKLSAPQALVS
jgi:hypothetical protein